MRRTAVWARCKTSVLQRARVLEGWLGVFMGRDGGPAAGPPPGPTQPAPAAPLDTAALTHLLL